MALELFQLKFKVAGQVIELNLEIPIRPVFLSEVLPALRAFTDQVLQAEVKQLKAQGRTISCGASCGACCRQLVPISEPEAEKLVEVIQRMPIARQKQLWQRFEQAQQTLQKNKLLMGLREQLKGEENQDALFELGVAYFKLGIPCPFLEDESCSIHPERPLICREYMVTSDPVHCQWPAKDRVEGVYLPYKLSDVLVDMASQEAPAKRRVVMTDLLDWKSSRAPSQKKRTGPEWLQLFIHGIKKHGSRKSQASV